MIARVGESDWYYEGAINRLWQVADTGSLDDPITLLAVYYHIVNTRLVLL